MCICLNVQECLCIHVCVFADVYCEGLIGPLDFGVGRKAGHPSSFPGKGIWSQPGPTDQGLRPGSAA